MKGILFSAPMVRAILERRKAVTRRIISPQPDGISTATIQPYKYTSGIDGREFIKPPYRPGDIVYVKETWATSVCLDDKPPRDTKDHGLPFWYLDGSVMYTGARTGGVSFMTPGKKRSPLFMPEWAARLHLEILNVRPERVQAITDEEAYREGIPEWKYPDQTFNPIVRFHELWDSLHPGSWEQNPYVWRIEFKERWRA